jgi:cation:H+ antiporter
MEIISALAIILITSFVIWKSGEGFESASDYLGRNLSNGVKGATINAIGSSMPELLTTFFFLFLLKNAEGFAGGLGTTAGSAVFNAVVIPFIVGISVFFKFKKTSLSFSKKVVIRDGISLILVDILLIIMIKSGSENGAGLSWKEGAILMGFYILYLVYLFAKMDKNDKSPIQKESKQIREVIKRKKRDVFKSLGGFNFTEAFLGPHEINNKRAWTLLVFSMIVMSAGCYGLVEGSIYLGEAIGIPIFVVSVVIVAAATSVPDTYLSFKDASKGNYDDSLSNAFGSNVFDIGFAIGFPIFIFGLIYGDINLSSSIERDISELLILLLIITVIVFIIFISGSQLTVVKVFSLFALYISFLVIVLAKAFELEFIKGLSEILYKISDYFVI